MRRDDSRAKCRLSSRVRHYAGTLLTGIAGVVLVLAFVWVIWVILGTFRTWQDGQLGVFDLTWGVLRASIVLLVLSFYLN